MEYDDDYFSDGEDIETPGAFAVRSIASSQGHHRRHHEMDDNDIAEDRRMMEDDDENNFKQKRRPTETLPVAYTAELVTDAEVIVASFVEKNADQTTTTATTTCPTIS